MNRRRFIKISATSLALTQAPLTGWALSEDTWSRAFERALVSKPRLIGYRSVSRDSFSSQASMRGKWPSGLQGVLYRNGPAGHEVGDLRYRHWFDGDGMLQAFRISPTRVCHQARMVRTSKLLAERAAGRALFPAFGTRPPKPIRVTAPDDVSSGNTSVLLHHDKLLALWEAGSPWEIDPDTLETKGRYAFSDLTRGVPFSAHPRIEPDGTLWNFGYVSDPGLLVFWHIDSTGKLKNVGKVAASPMGMPHDFIVTRKHIVVLISPFYFEPEDALTFLDAHEWHPHEPTRVLVVDKNDFDNHRWLELPAQWIFHFGNGWEDHDGVIRFDAARSPNPATMVRTLRDIMRGETTPGSASQHYQYRIDPRRGVATESPLLHGDIRTEFPTIDPRVSCERYRRLVVLSRSASSSAPHPEFDEVRSVNVDSGRSRFYRYPDSQIPEEHLLAFEPGSQPEVAGWIVGTALDWQQRRTVLNAFDADYLSDGPVASATLPYHLPLGFHGKFYNA